MTFIYDSDTSMLPSKSNSFNPFPGLRPFNQEEDYLFFGREQQIAELMTLLRQQRFTAVTGTSGSGKSSLVRAGLIPELQGGMMKEAGSDWETLVLRPGGSPLRNLAAALAESQMEDPNDPKVMGELLATLNHSGLGLVEAIRQGDFPDDCNILILVDQFEEIFRFQQGNAANQEEAADFVELLLEAGKQTKVPIYIIATMRSDYLGDCTNFRGLTEAINEGEYLIPRLTRDQIRSCIEGPIRVGGGKISYALTQELLNSIGGAQDQLPVLQHALMRTFDQWVNDESDAEALELHHYRDVGGMEEALSRHADEVFQELRPELHGIAEGLFKAITELGVDNRGIRRPTRLDTLTEIVGADLEEVCEVVEAYRQPGVTFLMPPDDVELLPETVVDISHESLMRVWRRLETWVEQESQSARIFRRLSDTAELHRDGRAGLYRDPDLQLALSWRDTTEPTQAWANRYADGFALAIDFLEQSEAVAHEAELRKEEDRRRELEQAKALAAAEAQRAELQQRAARRMRALSLGVAAIACLALVAFVYALTKQQEAQRQKVLAETNAAEAGASKKEAESNAEEARRLQLLSEEAQKQAEDSAEALNATLTRSQFVTAHEHLASGQKNLSLAYLARSLRTEPNYWQAAAQIVAQLSGQNFQIQQPVPMKMDEPFPYLGMDKRKRRAWTLTQDLTGAIWDTQTAKQLGIMNQGKPSDWPEFTQDGTLLYVALPENGGSIVGLSTDTGEAVTPVMAVKDRYNKPFKVASRVPDEIRILLDDPQTRQLKFWNGVTGDAIALSGHSDAPLVNWGYGYSPDHRLVYGLYENKTFSVWRTTDGSPVVLDQPHGLAVDEAGVSPDSQWMVLTSTVEQAVVWKPLFNAEGTEPIDSMEEGGGFQRVKFNFPPQKMYFHPQKPWVLLAGRVGMQGMLRVLDLESGKTVTSVTQNEFGARSTTSLAGFRFLGADEEDRILKRWIIGVATNEAESIRIMDLESGDEIHRFDFDDSTVSVANFTADGGRLVTSHEDHTLRIWDVFSGELIAPPIEHPYMPQFTLLDDGDKVVTFNVGDMSIRMYSALTGELLMEPMKTENAGFMANVRQLGDRTQYASFEKSEITVNGVGKLVTGQLWRWSMKPRTIQPVSRSYQGQVNRADLSPDGTQVVAGSDVPQGKVKVWNVLNQQSVYSLPHPSNVKLSLFSPDGSRVITGSIDGVVRIWDLEGAGTLQRQIDVQGEPDHIAFRPGHDHILVTTTEGRIGVWDIQQGFPLFEPISRAGFGQFSKDGRQVIVAGEEGLIHLFDAETGEDRTLDIDHNSQPGLNVGPAGKYIVTTVFNGNIRVIDLASGEAVWTSPYTGANLACAFHPDGDLVVCSNASNSAWEVGQVDVWNWRTGKRPVEALKAEGQIYEGALTFSPDGRYLAGGTVKGLLVVWEVSTGKPLYRIQQHAGRINTVKFSDDGRRLLTSGRDSQFKVLEMPPFKEAIPDWLPDLAEAVAEKRVNADGALEVVDDGSLKAIRNLISESDAGNGYNAWGTWYLQGPLSRNISPLIETSTQEYLAAKSRSYRLDDQYEALHLDPNNGLISCRIGYLKAIAPRRASMNDAARRHWDQMALWYCQQGTELSPDSGEAWALQAAVQQIVGRPAEASVAKAIELDPASSVAWLVNAFELQGQGLEEEAYQAFSKALQNLPENRHFDDWNGEKPFCIGTLRRVLSKNERDPVTLAESGVERLSESIDTPERRRTEAEWLTRYACELAPQDSVVWRSRYFVLTSLGRNRDAVAIQDRFLDLDENGEPKWRQVGQLHVETANSLIGLKMGQVAHKYLLKNGIPPRSAAATENHVDLSDHYNQTLFEKPYRGTNTTISMADTFFRLPVGLTRLNGVTFDVRGMISLSGSSKNPNNFPNGLPVEVSGIKVGQKADYLHFLHNVDANPDASIPAGTQVGQYDVVYADGETASLPIRFGEDVVKWNNAMDRLPTWSRIGWDEGVYNTYKVLCQTCWENPRPAVEIESVNFVSANANPAPFLVAITLERQDQLTRDDPEMQSRVAWERAAFTRGQTELTHQWVDQRSKDALETSPDASALKFYRAGVLGLLGQPEPALEMVRSLREGEPEVPFYRILQAEFEWESGEREAAWQTLRFPAGETGVLAQLSPDETILLGRFRTKTDAALGGGESRKKWVEAMVPPRTNTTSSRCVDLTSFYNASLDESWYTPKGFPNFYTKFMKSLRPGEHVVRGIPFDIRGLIQLNDRELIQMSNLFPKSVSGIPVNLSGDQVHFLHSCFSSERPGTPVVAYRIQLENGDVHVHSTRYGVDIEGVFISRDSTPANSVALIRQGVTKFAGLSDMGLHQSTWNNPTPDIKISEVEMLIAPNRSQPFLAAMTVESFQAELDSDPDEAPRLADLALGKIQQGVKLTPALTDYVTKLCLKVENDQPENAQVLAKVAEVRRNLGDLESALDTIDQALTLNPEAASSYRIKRDILAAMGRYDDAGEMDAREQAVALAERIADRAAQTEARYVDLGEAYNFALNQMPYETFNPERILSENFSQLTPGLQKFGQSDFDVRGIAMLRSQTTDLWPIRHPLPEKIEGIQVAEKAGAIRLLHGAGFVSDPHGTVIAEIVVNYEDGTTESIPISSGEHVRDWFLSMTGKRSVSDGELVWVQASPEVNAREIGVYELKWSNPNPEKVIESLDYASKMQKGASFLLGVTLDP